MMETTDTGTDGSPERPPTASTGEQGTENPPDTPVTDPPPAGSGGGRSPARLAVGLVLLAADRLRIGDAVPAPARTALTTSLGLAGEAAGAVRHRRREAVRTVRAVAGTVDRLANRFADDHRTLTAPARRGTTAVRDRLDRARRAGDAVVSAGRADAEKYVAGRVEDTLTWAGRRVLPPLLDMAVPQLIDDVVPRILDGVLPQIRNRLVPAIIDDLADDPAVRDLVREQSRGLAAAAAAQIQDATGMADDRIETGLRRLFGGHR
jgi:hypothetical protein